MRVRQRGGDDGDRRPAPAARCLQGARQHEREGQCEEHDQAVHAGFGAVADRVGRGGEQQQRRDAGAQFGVRLDVSERRRHTRHAAACEIGQRQRRDREDTGQRADGDVAVSEDRHPVMQQQVVERRRTVMAQGGEQLREVTPRDLDRQGFVEPDVAGGDEPERRAREHRDDHKSDQIYLQRLPVDPTVDRAGHEASPRLAGRRRHGGFDRCLQRGRRDAVADRKRTGGQISGSATRGVVPRLNRCAHAAQPGAITG